VRPQAGRLAGPFALPPQDAAEQQRRADTNHDPDHLREIRNVEQVVEADFHGRIVGDRPLRWKTQRLLRGRSRR
jgi:hypothetical protein